MAVPFRVLIVVIIAVIYFLAKAGKKRNKGEPGKSK
jgi:hypothetical protein